MWSNVLILSNKRNKISVLIAFIVCFFIKIVLIQIRANRFAGTYGSDINPLKDTTDRSCTLINVMISNNVLFALHSFFYDNAFKWLFYIIFEKFLGLLSSNKKFSRIFGFYTLVFVEKTAYISPIFRFSPYLVGIVCAYYTKVNRTGANHH